MRVAESISSARSSFGTWLLRQGERRDAVGFLARGAQRDREFDVLTKPQELRRRLTSLDAGQAAHRALREAEREWGRLCRHSTGLADRRQADPRKAIQEQAERSGHSLAEMSSALGRSEGYLARFVREGVPTMLSARDHQFLADVLGVDQRALGVRDLWAHV